MSVSCVSLTLESFSCDSAVPSTSMQVTVNVSLIPRLILTGTKVMKVGYTHAKHIHVNMAVSTPPLPVPSDGVVLWGVCCVLRYKCIL